MATIGPTLSPAAASVPGEAHDSGVCLIFLAPECKPENSRKTAVARQKNVENVRARARQKAAEQKAKVRYHDGVVVTRTGEKYTPVPLTKEEEERERALKAATSVNLAYKTSKGRRHKGR